MQPRLLSEPLRLASGPLLRLQTDERLVALVRAGSHPAFAEVVHRYRPALVRYTGRLVGDDRAEDVVQQGLASAHTALMSDERPIDLKPWLYRIVHNGALNVLRGDRDVVMLDEHEADQIVPGVEAQVEERERFRSVIGAVQALPTAQRDALLLRELEGRSHEEIASALGVTAGSARQHLMRARTTMRAAVTAVTPYPLALKLAALGAGAGAAGLPAAGALTGAGAGFSLSKLGAGVLAAGALAGGADVVVPAIVPGPRIERTERTEPTRPAVSPASGARVSSTTPAGPAAARALSSATGDVGRRARESRARSNRRLDDAREREGRSGRETGGERERRGQETMSPSRGDGGHGSPLHAGDDHADDDRHDRPSGSGRGPSVSGSSGPGSGSSGAGDSGSGDSGSRHPGSGGSGSGGFGRSGSGSSGSGSGDLSPGSSSGSGSSGSGSGGSGSLEDADDHSGSGDGDATP